MGDIRCRVCGAPWDSYGVYQSLIPDGDGDMEPWEAKKFLAGEGCPCCHFGKDAARANKEELEEDFLSDVTDSGNTDEDPIDILMNLADPKKVKT